MINSLLYIRSRQIKREADGLGLYLIIFIAIALIFSYLAFNQYNNSKQGWWLVILLSAICLSIHYYRKDKNFIYKQLEKPYLQIFAEYALLTLPFSISSIITKNWFCFPLILLILFSISFLKFQFKRKAVFTNLSSLIPASNFEWRSGIRKQYITFISIYLVALGFSWVRILPLFLLWFLTIMIASFFQENEPIHILREGNKNAKRFLSDKLKVNMMYLLILYSLPIIINALFVHEFLLITLMFIPVQIALLCFVISLKYATYKPQMNQLGNNIAFSIVAILSAMPYFLPIPVILSIVYFYKARKNLNIYLHD